MYVRVLDRREGCGFDPDHGVRIFSGGGNTSGPCTVRCECMLKGNSGSFFHHILISVFSNDTILVVLVEGRVVQFAQKLTNNFKQPNQRYVFRPKPKHVYASCSVNALTSWHPRHQKYGDSARKKMKATISYPTIY